MSLSFFVSKIHYHHSNNNARRRLLLLRVLFDSTTTSSCSFTTSRRRSLTTSWNSTTTRRYMSNDATTTTTTNHNNNDDEMNEQDKKKHNVVKLVHALRQLDTACLCDADKAMRSSSSSTTSSWDGLRVLDSTRIRPMNQLGTGKVMVGMARTVQCTKRNDFLAVLRGLDEAREGEVLVVDTIDSNHAVAGELFTLEANRKGLAGIVIDGPMRDVATIQKLDDALQIRCFASSITPYSGTITSPGKMQTIVSCGGIRIRPNNEDIVVGDDDGILVGSLQTFDAIVPKAQEIQTAEEFIQQEILDDKNLISMTNYHEHLQLRLEGKPSLLQFQIKSHHNNDKNNKEEK